MKGIFLAILLFVMMMSMSACNSIKEEKTVGDEVSRDEQESNGEQSNMNNNDEKKAIEITQDTVIDAREASGGIGSPSMNTLVMVSMKGKLL